MLTKFEFCAFLGMLYNTLKDCIFFDDVMRGQGQINFRIFRSKCKDDVINIQSPRPSLDAMLIFHAIYTGIFFILFHNNNLSN